MLEYKGATVTKIHTQTPEYHKQRLVRHSDIIVSCVGRDMRDLLSLANCTAVEALIGVGFRYEDGRQVQDFNIDAFWDDIKCTPNTKGTGMATISALLMNIVACDKATKFISMEEK